ncbi:MAG: AAA family ATPase [Paracoccaceae bacterium]|nr:AAA family ATPase [Paracoccaceae bacterium]
MHTISCLGFKGGAGRTTTAAALAVGLVSIGQRVALIDAGYAVPLEEQLVITGRGHGAVPDHSVLGRWAETAQNGSFCGGELQYIRATTAPYLKVVLDQLWRENWAYAIVDTPAHQTASVFEAADRSSLLIAPARNASDAREIRDRLPDEFLIRQDRLRCLVAGAEQPQKVRAAFSPLSILTTELPFESNFLGFIPHHNRNKSQSTSKDHWQRRCIQLADEVLELISERESMAS